MVGFGWLIIRKNKYFGGIKMKKWGCLSLVLCLLIFGVSCTTKTASFETLFLNGKYAEAYDLYNESISGNADKELEVQNILETILQNTYDYYCQDKVTYDDLEKMLKQINEYEIVYDFVLEIEPKIREMNNSKRSFELAKKAIDENDYITAIKKLNIISDEDINKKTATKLLQECEEKCKTALFAEVNELVTIGNFADAISKLEKVYNSVTIKGVSEKLKEIKIAYANSYIIKAKDLAANKDFVTAIAQLDIALEITPDNTEILPLKQEYTEKIPIDITTLNSISQSDRIKIEVNAIDNYSNQYQSAIYFRNISKENSQNEISYNSSGKYDRIKGVICLPQEHKNSKGISYFEILADGIVVYKSQNITEGTAPQSFDIKINKAQKVTIKNYSIKTELYGNYIYVYIANVFLCKD